MPPIWATLDASQCVRAGFDESTGKFRTDATATIVAGDITVEIDGIYTPLNPAPDNIGLIGHTRAITPTALDQIIRLTAVNNASVHALDIALHLSDGSSVDALNPLPVSFSASSIQVTQGTSPWVVSGSVSISNFPAIQAVSQSGTWTTGRTWTLSSGTDSVASVQSGTWNINNITGTVSLPTGASTSALQTSGNASLSSIDGKLNSLGQKVSAASVPVVIASDQSAIPVTGTITTSPNVNIHDSAGGNLTSTGTSLNTNITNTSIPVTQSGTWNLNNITGTVSLPTGAATSALQTSGNASLSSIDSKTPALGQALAAGSVPVVLTAAQLATLTPLSTVAVTQSTSPWVISGTVTANIGTTNGLALDSSVNGLLRAIGSTTSGQSGPLIQGAVTTASPTYSTGQTNPLSLTTSGLLRVDGSGSTQPVSGTVTANQGTSPWVVSGTVAATQSGTWNINNISGTVSLPTGASTSALQTTGNTSLSSIVTNTTPLTLAQGSTTSGQLANLILGAATTAAPTYSTGTSNPLSLTTAGALRTDSSGSTQPISGTVTANQGTSPWVVSGTVAATQSGTWTVNQGASALPGNAWYTRITDGATTVGITGFSLNTNITNTSLSVTQGTSPWVVSGTTTAAEDKNYGTVGATTLRTAAQIGNATGAALFGAGTTTAQVLRVVLPTDQTAIPATQSGTWTVQPGNTANTTAWLVTGTGGTFPATQSGAWTTGRTWTLSSGTDSLAAIVSGFAASGATKSGNPVQIGGVFNTTQPTVSTGQMVEAQSTSRGALIVATGVDAFTVKAQLQDNAGTAITLGQKIGASSLPMVQANEQTYSASITGLATAATATDIFTITGSGTKTVKIKKIRTSANRTTSTTTDLLLIKRSAANTGGTSTTQTAAPHDSNNNAATATVLAYTANPTSLGAAVATIRSQKQFINVAASGTSDVVDWFFGENTSQPIVLRGTSQVLAVNLNSVTVTSPTFDIYIEWTEET